MKIEAVLFDLGKVIIDFDMAPLVEAMLPRCGASREKFDEVLWDKSWMRRYERGEISTKDFYDHLCQGASLQMELPQFCHVWSSVFAPDPNVSEELLAALRRKYPLILISNTNEAHADYLRKNYRIFDYFDHHIFSFQVGSLKPDAKIFEHAIRAAGRPPDALFFTDDRPENILAARELGIYAHQFVSEQGLIDALREAGVEVT